MKKLILFSFLFSGMFLMQIACTTTGKKGFGDVAGLSGDSIQAALNIVRQYVDEGKLAGVSVLVIRNNETVLKHNIGYADIQNNQKIEDNTIFRIFSMTKPVTAAALMTLYDEGKFQLDDKVADFIPEFATTMVYNAETKTLEPQITPMTIRHLLTHTAGFTYGWDQKSYVDSLYRVTGASAWDGVLADKMKILAGIPLKNQPGTKYEYSVSIDVAGYLVEVLSGLPLDQYMKTKIFDPLKMEDTGFYVPEEKHSRFTAVYTLKNDSLTEQQALNGMSFIKPVTLFSGGGGLVSTIDDYSKFAQMLLNGGEFNGVRILKESTVEMIMTNQLQAGVNYENGGSYGLGGYVNPEKGLYGWSGAASTNFVVDKKNNMVIITCTQFMPFNIEHSMKFVEKVESAVIQ